MHQTRQHYTETVKRQLDELNSQIDSLEAKAEAVREEARQGYQAELKKLRAQSHQAATQFSALQRAGEESWDQMSNQMDKLREAFRHSFDYFKV
ncbi:hypothetical protein RQP53_00570 [Paucibacter sp. APW11]|uniref:Uncharacterized protein n=1 Tax=Roseateles aquae TaxID=3077235 RepID=A0ABU3P663_9BURK|nr:hypothetical protein [Paucibacter sp. APW11]MDT8997762.1 hypothetical protein [Paucibacter sp. APW11]